MEQMSERAELRVRIEDTGSRFMVMGRWILDKGPGTQPYEADLFLGTGDTMEEAVQIAGMFGTAAAGVVDKLARNVQAFAAPNDAAFAVLHNVTAARANATPTGAQLARTEQRLRQLIDDLVRIQGVSRDQAEHAIFALLTSPTDLHQAELVMQAYDSIMRDRRPSDPNDFTYRPLDRWKNPAERNNI